MSLGQLRSPLPSACDHLGGPQEGPLAQSTHWAMRENNARMFPAIWLAWGRSHGYRQSAQTTTANYARFPPPQTRGSSCLCALCMCVCCVCGCAAQACVRCTHLCTCLECPTVSPIWLVPTHPSGVSSGANLSHLPLQAGLSSPLGTWAPCLCKDFPSAC